MRARLREDHVAARRLDDAAAVAVDAPALGDTEPAQALAGPAMLLTGDGERVLAAADGVLEADRDGLVQIGPTRRRVARPAAGVLMQDIREQVAKRRRVGAARAHREVEPFEAERRLLDVRPGVADRVVLAASIRIAQRFVGLGNLSEMGGRRPVARVDVRVIFAGEPLVRALDLAKHRGAVHSEDYVEIHPGPD